MNRLSRILWASVAVLLHLVPIALFFRPEYNGYPAFLDYQIGGYLVGDYCAALSSIGATAVGLVLIRVQRARAGRIIIVMVVSAVATLLVIIGIFLTPLTGTADYSGPVIYLVGCLVHIAAALVLVIMTISSRVRHRT